MASIQAWVQAGIDITAYEFDGPNGWAASLDIDGVTVYVSDPLVTREKRNASIVDATNMLIGALVGLRDAAERRIISEANEQALTESELRHA